MCDMNNDCNYEGEMNIAYGPKDVYLYCPQNDKEYRIPSRMKVEVCPECDMPNWRTLEKQ